MRVFHWRPDGPLGVHVDRIWGWESHAQEKVRLPILMPGTGAEVFFHYRTPFRFEDCTKTQRTMPSSHLICARRKVITLCDSGDVGFLAVRFRAGSIHRFTDVRPNDLADNLISADQLWGKAGRQLHDALLCSDVPSDRAAILQSFLLDRLDGGHGDEVIERAVQSIYYDCAKVTISSLAGTLGIGRRQLERRTRRVTGQSLVELRTASRFQKVVRHLLLTPSANPLSTVLKYGFYDQSHFTRTCKSFGLPPPGAAIRKARSKTHFYNPPSRDFASCWSR